jgi:hypothetical protein
MLGADTGELGQPGEPRMVFERVAGATAGKTPRPSEGTDGSLQCGACGTAHDPALMAIDEVVRFEGASDPDDELLMLALRCECACPGLYVTGFGSSASPADVAVLHRLR